MKRRKEGRKKRKREIQRRNERNMFRLEKLRKGESELREITGLTTLLHTCTKELRD